MNPTSQLALTLVPPEQRVDEKRLAELRSFGPAQARREAHEAIQAKDKERIWGRILAWAMKAGEFTVDSMAAEWGCPTTHLAPRVTELLQLGRLVSTGKRRKTRMGRGAAVLAARKAGV